MPFLENRGKDAESTQRSGALRGGRERSAGIRTCGGVFQLFEKKEKRDYSRRYFHSRSSLSNNFFPFHHFFPDERRARDSPTTHTYVSAASSFHASWRFLPSQRPAGHCTIRDSSQDASALRRITQKNQIQRHGKMACKSQKIYLPIHRGDFDFFLHGRRGGW